MNRKAFLKNSLFGTAGIGLALNNLSCDSMKRITILHTNDVHSHIEPFSKDHSEFPNKGGFERRSTIINKIRNASKVKDNEFNFSSSKLIKPETAIA